MYKYLFKNMALFTVSSFVSKLLVFLLVPFYTSVLTEAEYGTADVMQSALLLLVPLLTLNAGEAALRFGLEGNKGGSPSEPDSRELYYGKILRSGLRRILISDVAVILLSGLFLGLISPFYSGMREYVLLFILLYVCDSFYEYMLLYCQGTERVQIMIMGSVSCTMLVIASNLIFLLVLDLGLTGYLMAQMVSFMGSGLLMFLLSGGFAAVKKAGAPEPDSGTPEKKRRLFGRRPPSLSQLSSEMQDYGASMLLYSTSSWINNAVDRFYIIIMLGSTQNGLYGAAYKIPAILQVFQRIFAQAWQMSAVKEYTGADREDFFSHMFRIYNAILVVGCSGLILVLKPLAFIMFRKGFYEAWPLVPPLVMSVVFGALEGFIGSIFLAFKDGKSIGRATGIGAAANLVLNYFGILEFGTMGAAGATLISYFIMFVLAYYMLKKHITLKVGFIKNLFAYILLLAESLFVIFNMKNYFILNGLILLVLMALYASEVKETALRMLKKRSGTGNP